MEKFQKKFQKITTFLKNKFYKNPTFYRIKKYFIWYVLLYY